VIRHEIRRLNGIIEEFLGLSRGGQLKLEIGDLAISIPPVAPSRRESVEWNYKHGFTTHRFIAGNGSFLYYTRASGAPPFLVVTVRPGTHLEYFERGTEQRHELLYIHSSLAGNAQSRGSWRQEHTARHLGPQGSNNAEVRYGFRLQFADSYDEMREILFREGLFDIRAVPGMTIPEDLTARFSLHTQAQLEAIESEFPDETVHCFDAFSAVIGTVFLQGIVKERQVGQKEVGHKIRTVQYVDRRINDPARCLQRHGPLQ